MPDPTVTDAIAGLKAAFLAISPPPGVNLGGRVWAWPADRASVAYATFPFIICAQVINENSVWRPASQGVGFHSWPAEVLICLNNWSSRNDVSAEDEAGAQAWLLNAARVMFDNRGLGGASLDIGTTEALFTSRIGELGWLSGQAFFGVYLRTTISQIQSLPSLG